MHVRHFSKFSGNAACGEVVSGRQKKLTGTCQMVISECEHRSKESHPAQLGGDGT